MCQEKMIGEEIKLRNDCYVSKTISNCFKSLKELYKTIGEGKFLDKFEQIHDFCEFAIDIKKKIEALSLVMFPQYTYARIDPYSLNKYLDGNNVLIKICFVSGIEEKGYVFFMPEEYKEEK